MPPIWAGEIWRYLDTHDGNVSLEALFSGIDAPRETVLMAVGWLAREGYVLMKGSSLSDCVVVLNSSQPV